MRHKASKQISFGRILAPPNLFVLVILVLLPSTATSSSSSSFVSFDEAKAATVPHVEAEELILTSRSPNAPPINYNGLHPFEQAEKHQRRSIQQSRNSNFYSPIRIVFDTSHLSSQIDTTATNQMNSKLYAILNDILPKTSSIWSSAVNVIPVSTNLKINAASLMNNNVKCPAKEQHSLFGVPNADLVIYVKGLDCMIKRAGDGTRPLPTTRNSLPCELDQFDRPIGGTMEFCLDTISTNRFDTVTQKTIDEAVRGSLREVGYILGVHPELFKFFRDPTDGQPLTPRPFTRSKVKCVSGSTQQVQKPACNTILPGTTHSGATYYQVVTPTVAQVTRNMFDCQAENVIGARLENQPNGDSCFGSGWELRLFTSEVMTSPYSSTEYVVSPLTLALLEDSGWYRANYSSPYIQSPSFGRGAGCSFLTEPCLTNQGRTIPPYSKGYFCNDLLSLTDLGLQGSYTCDATHTHKALCDLIDYNDKEMNLDEWVSAPPIQYQNFWKPTWGSSLYQNDYCPTVLASTETISCEDESAAFFQEEALEFYGEDSRCFTRIAMDDANNINATNATTTSNSRKMKPLCFKSKCNNETKVLEVMVGNSTFICSKDGQTHSFSDNNLFECPRVMSVCPHFFCPNDCAGRGVCDYDTGKCKCFDKFDNSPGCANTRIEPALKKLTECGDPVRDMSAAAGASGGFELCSMIMVIMVVILFA